MRSSKSRSRSRSNRNKPSGGNIINRVFDSSGPEGKVRGTPQQIIDKYTQLARDAFLSNDRVAAENFQQHAEHYTRLLGEATREAEARRVQADQQNRERQERERAEREARKEAEAAAEVPTEGGSADVVDPATSAEGDSGLVETPENAPKKSRSRSRKSTSSKAEKAEEKAPQGPDSAEPTEAAQ